MLDFEVDHPVRVAVCSRIENQISATQICCCVDSHVAIDLADVAMVHTNATVPLRLRRRNWFEDVAGCTGTEQQLPSVICASHCSLDDGLHRFDSSRDELSVCDHNRGIPATVMAEKAKAMWRYGDDVDGYYGWCHADIIVDRCCDRPRLKHGLLIIVVAITPPRADATRESESW
jgi:hypothetical protein